MKTLVCTETNRSLYLLEDTAFVQFTEKEIHLLDLIIGDRNSNNTVLFENVEAPPEGYIGGKYFYTAEDGWEIDPAFSVISPTEEPR